LKLYVDTSVLAAYYCPEALSDRVEKILIETEEPALSLLSEVELHSALSRKVRMGELSGEAAGQVRACFGEHLDRGYFVRLDLEDDHYRQASQWIGHLNAPLRTLDALHLATCQSAQCRMLTADTVLADACREVGVEVECLLS